MFMFNFIRNLAGKISLPLQADRHHLGHTGKVDTKEGVSTPQNVCFPSLCAQDILGLYSTTGWKRRPVHFTPHTAPLCQREIRAISSLTYIWGVENPLSIHQGLMG